VTRSIVIAAALCAVLAGCGGTTTRTITEPTSASGGAGSTGPAPAGPPITITTPTGGATAPPPQPTGGTLSQAEAAVKKQGFNVDNTTDYQPAQTLRVLIGTRTGSSEGFARRAFFFVGGRFIGTDTSDDSADITVDSQSDSVVTLAYRLYRKGEPLCCPTGGVAKVRYRWDGSSLSPLDTIPSSSASASLSRL
jgi:LppP/LprE lipoprotein